MQGKRFVAPNMRLALKMVREELGPDAVILSNKQVPEGVELLTAVDVSSSPMFGGIDHSEGSSQSKPAVQSIHLNDNPFVQNEPSEVVPPKNVETPKPSLLEQEVERMRSEARQKAHNLAAALAEKYKEQKGNVEENLTVNQKDTAEINARLSDTGDLPVKPPSQAVSPITEELSPRAAETVSADVIKNTELEQMRNEMQSMRDLLEQQLSSMAWGQYSSSHPEKASQWRRLKRMGIGAQLANSLIDSANLSTESTESWQAVMASLSRRLPVITDDIIAGGGIFAFVGPTGAGKTTTIGKLAAHYVLKNGAADVALVTLDTLRIAAQEQLRTVARILNVPVKIVDKNNPLDRVLYSLRRKSLVLIDTAGLNPSDAKLNQQLNAINELGDQAKSLLVIPTTSQEQVIKAAFHTYKTDNLAACVLTKLDETMSLGESIGLAIEKKLPVAYSTNGQNIPDDIAVADKVALVKSAIRMAKNTEVDEASMADEIASLSRGG
jgi:flagellar biosynthesis protein FlhF